MHAKTPHTHSIEGWTHAHEFDDASLAGLLQKRILIVTVVTVATMIVEIIGGWFFGSMAVLADGWHMGTHALALGLAWFSYRYARRNRAAQRFTFGTGKVNVLGGFASALFLGMVGVLMVQASIERLLHPSAIRFGEALAVAVAGLLVNAGSAAIMVSRAGPHEHHGLRKDYNFSAAYLHVLADAATSILAIIALCAAMLFGWMWLDPVTAMAGAVLILLWAWGLLRKTGRILLDSAVTDETYLDIKARIEAVPDTSVADVHVWYVSNVKKAAIVSIVAGRPEPPSFYKERLQGIDELDHVLVEVNQCPECGKERHASE